MSLRLGVNIDHVATVRNARGGEYPSPIAAALLAQKAGADGITAHLREDRRHIRDADMQAIKKAITIPLNFEMAATTEMQSIALTTQPNAICLVPEKREEITTEGGLDVVGQKTFLSDYIQPFKNAGIRVSLFIDATPEQVKAAADLNADIIELHTGRYSELNDQGSIKNELKRINQAAKQGTELGLEIHAGHGLRYDNVAQIAAIKEIIELNIGHFLIADSIFVGLERAIKTMRNHMQKTA